MTGFLVVVPLIALAVSILFTIARVFLGEAVDIGIVYEAMIVATSLYAFVVSIPAIMGFAELANAWATRAADDQSPIKIECRFVGSSKWTGLRETESPEQGRVVYFCPLPCIEIKICWNGVEP